MIGYSPLSPTQILAVADLLGQAMDFILVDLRSGTPEVAIHHRRAWARGGWRQTPLLVDGIGTLMRDIRDKKLPCAALLPPVEGDSEVSIDAFLELPEVKWVRWTLDGRLVHQGVAMVADEEQTFDDRGTTTLVLRLDREERIPEIDLPFHLPVELPVGANADPRVGVMAISTIDAPIPEQRWFSVTDGPQHGILEIDIQARHNGDQWKLSYRGEAGAAGHLRRAHAPTAPALAPGRTIQRLAVILDRTCPDRAHWSDALTTVLGSGLRVGSTATRYDVVEDPEAGVAPADYNRELRLALADSLEAALANSEVLVDGWWVADVPGEGVGWFGKIDRPARPVHPAGTERPGGFTRLFSGATWSPGLDLWDPVQLALEEALNALESDRDRRGAVLIVGDSPPDSPLDPTCPFRDVARALGHQTSVRRPDARWALQVERAAKLGIPVVWLFLEHDLCHVDHQRFHDQARKVQGMVGTALACSVSVVTELADREGVVRGVRAALDAASTNTRRRTGVRLRRMEVP